MRLLCLLSLLIPSSLAVPNQTAEAKATLDKMSRRARTLSDAAKPDVVSYFESTSFRKEIANLTTLKSYTGEQLRQWFVGNVRKTNVIVTFDVEHWDDIVSAGHVFNKWQLIREGAKYPSFSLKLAEYTETKLMGFPEITNLTNPTYEEANTRPLYFAVNIWKKANGNPMYGDTNFVVHPSRKSNFLLLPSDSGWWYKVCVDGQVSKPAVDCKSYTKVNETAGTFDHFNHLILTHNRFYKYPISELFKRFYNNSFASPPAEVNYYYEGDMAAAFWVPQHVWYTILDWTKLWGHATARPLQSWHRNNSLPLAWSAEVNHMYLDATVGGFHGYTITSQDIKDFDNNWRVPKSDEEWYTVYNKISDGLHLYPLREGDCGDGVCGPHCDYVGLNSNLPPQCIHTGYLS